MEPREKATSFHAAETCRCCGQCVGGNRPSWCPNVLRVEQILLSPQGYGPARNIVGFTGGDLTCRPDFYCRCAEQIKEETSLWVLVETNGFGLMDQNLRRLRDSGVDAFWLDIKAFDDRTHRWLTGVPVTRILGLPAKMLQHGFVVEVLSLYIPGVVETQQLEQIAELLVAVDPSIPFTILAFFPEHEMLHVRSPTFAEMRDAYSRCRDSGLKNIRLGNTGVFVKSVDQQEYLIREGIW
jgi:pyruvate-formate lyase-activating enzyme